MYGLVPYKVLLLLCFFGLPLRWISPGMKVHIALFNLAAAPPQLMMKQLE